MEMDPACMGGCSSCELCSEWNNIADWFMNSAHFECVAREPCAITTWANDVTNFHSSAFDPAGSCGCLSGLMMHEAVHGVRNDPDGEQFEPENDVRGDTGSCIACSRSAPSGSPRSQ